MLKLFAKYYCDMWLNEERSSDTSIEEFVLATKEKILEESDMLVNKFGFSALATPGAQNIITKEYILEELILRGLDHERNGGDTEVVRGKFKKVFDIYDQIQEGHESRFVSHCSSSNICVCLISSFLQCLVTKSLNIIYFSTKSCHPSSKSLKNIMLGLGHSGERKV